MRITLEGTYDSTWTVEKDDVVAVKATVVRAPSGGPPVPVLRLFLKPELGELSENIWLTDCATNRKTLGMPTKKKPKAKKEPATND